MTVFGRLVNGDDGGEGRSEAVCDNVCCIGMGDEGEGGECCRAREEAIQLVEVLGGWCAVECRICRCRLTKGGLLFD